MHTEFQLPYITGKTTQEQVGQIIAYLRNMALLLQQLPGETAQTPATSEPLPTRKFTELTVREKLKLEGTVNGIALGTKQLRSADRLWLQSQFSQWQSGATRQQTIFLLGSIQGCILITETGQCSWNGTAGVTVSGEKEGQVAVSFPQPVTETLLVLSTGKFT